MIAYILPSYHPVSFSKYFIQCSYLRIKIITNKRTDKSDHLHFAIISPSFFFKTLLPVFISINIITNKKDQTKMPCLHFAIISPSFFFKVLHPVFISTYVSKQLLTKEQTKVTTYILPSYHPVSFSKYFIQCSYLRIKIITNKRTDKSDHLHFAIVSPSFFFKVLHPVFISTYQNNY